MYLDNVGVRWIDGEQLVPRSGRCGGVAEEAAVVVDGLMVVG